MSPCIYFLALAYKTRVWCRFSPIPQHVHVHTRKHTSIDSAAATAAGADVDVEGSVRLVSSTQSTTFSTSNARTSLIHFLRPQYPSLPPLLNKPQNSLQTVSQRSFTVPTLIRIQSAQFQRSSAELHNGPFRSCRKNRGMAKHSRAPIGEHTRGPV